MEKKLKFEVGKKYFDKIHNDNFTVKIIDKKKSEIGIHYENGTHPYIAKDDGNIYFRLVGLLTKHLNTGIITLVEPEKTESK